jgi:L-lysine 2,3-aminomutase
MELVFKFEPVKRAPIYGGASDENWSQWAWQMRQSLNTANDFSEVFKLSPDELEGFKHHESFKVATTPYYASLATSLSATHPIRKILMPSGLETAPEK